MKRTVYDKVAKITAQIDRWYKLSKGKVSRQDYETIRDVLDKYLKQNRMYSVSVIRLKGRLDQLPAGCLRTEDFVEDIREIRRNQGKISPVQ